MQVYLCVITGPPVTQVNKPTYVCQSQYDVISPDDILYNYNLIVNGYQLKQSNQSFVNQDENQFNDIISDKNTCNLFQEDEYIIFLYTSLQKVCLIFCHFVQQAGIIQYQFTINQVDFYSVLRVSDYQITDYLGNVRYLKNIGIQYIPAIFTNVAMIQLSFIDVSEAFIIPKEFTLQFSDNKMISVSPTDRNLRVRIDAQYFNGIPIVQVDNYNIKLEYPNVQTQSLTFYMIFASLVILIITYVIVRINFSKIQQKIGYKASSILAIFLNKQTESMILKSQEHFMQQQFKFNDVSQIQKNIFMQKENQLLDLEIADSWSIKQETLPGKLEYLFPQVLSSKDEVIQIPKDEISVLQRMSTGQNEAFQLELSQDTEQYE